jgi:hypothetical protein
LIQWADKDQHLLSAAMAQIPVALQHRLHHRRARLLEQWVPLERRQDASTYLEPIAIPHATSLDTTLPIPSDAQPGQTIHVILEATDNGTPSSTRYQRVIVTVQAAAP